MAWWRRQPWTAPESVPANVKYECVPGLGSPDIASCENVSFEMLGSEEIVLEPANKPFINVVGMYIPSELAVPTLSSVQIQSSCLLKMQVAYSWCVYCM